MALLEPHPCGCATVCRQVPGDRGRSCPGAGWLPPLWAAHSAAAGCRRRGNLSEGQGGAVCLAGRADPKTCCWLQHFVSYHTENTGTGAAQRLHSRKLLLHFAPDVFQGKLLAEWEGEMWGKEVVLGFACPTSPLQGYRKPGREPCL